MSFTGIGSTSFLVFIYAQFGLVDVLLVAFSCGIAFSNHPLSILLHLVEEILLVIEVVIPTVSNFISKRCMLFGELSLLS